MDDTIYYVILAIVFTIPSTIVVFIICLKCCQRNHVYEKDEITKKRQQAGAFPLHQNVGTEFHISETDKQTSPYYEDVIQYIGSPYIIANTCSSNSRIISDGYAGFKRFMEVPGVTEGSDPTDIRIIDTMPQDIQPRPLIFAPPAPPDPPNIPI